MTLGCMICGDIHKATQKKFPYTKWGEREVEKDGQMVKEKYIEGYVCKKCIIKDLKRQQRKKEENAKQLPGNIQ